MRVIIPIGVPGVGKSTYVNKHFKNFTIISSDEIRKELYGSLKDAHKDPDNNRRAFDIFYSRMDEAVRNDVDIVLDATNLTLKYRMSLYQRVKKPHVTVEAHVFVNSLNNLFERNVTRPYDDQVPKSIVTSMYKSMQPPFIGYDCDEMYVHGDTASFLFEPVNVKKATSDAHNSPYHSESISDHVVMTTQQAADDYGKDHILVAVAANHDLGKYVCRTPNTKDTPQATFFREKNGAFDQFMGHENVGAMYYWVKCIERDGGYLSVQNELITKLILFHMLDDISIKVQKRYRLDFDFMTLHDQFKAIDHSAKVSSPYLDEYLSILKGTRV